MINFQAYVQNELALARVKYRPMASAHEGWAVLREEVDELWEEVKKKPSKRNTEAMYGELVQVAAMAQRMAEDIVLSGKAVEI
jgi:NTP pyrophosphatase (non-canonical NTP hydrolase)